MLFNKKRKNTIELSNTRGFAVTISLDGFNKINASANTDSDEFLIQAHIIVLKNCSALFNNKTVDFFTRQFLSIGVFRWNIKKIYNKIRIIARWIKLKFSFKR